MSSDFSYTRDMLTSSLLVSKGSQSEHAYKLILNQILRGRLVPGALLSRRGLAQALGLGVRPVTESLQRLEVEGLVESLPRIGTRVRLPSEQDIRGHYIVREALETESGRLFAEKGSDRERKELVAMATHLDSLYESSERHQTDTDAWENYWFEVGTTHSRFHMRIAECTGCPALCNALEKSHILIFNWLYDTAFYSRPNPGRWHYKLMEALNTGDVEVADKAMRVHVRYRMDEVLRRREVYGRQVESPLPSGISSGNHREPTNQA